MPYKNFKIDEQTLISKTDCYTNAHKVYSLLNITATADGDDDLRWHEARIRSKSITPVSP